ncbi:MAG: hypothetical protein Q7U30_15460, partial [Methylicorpusculum sp.]|nr:hypothetical protein [Methylicorpusculum sp.]
LNQEKTVFQLVGNLSFPSLIGHVKFGGDRLTFDFRSEQAYLSEYKQWKTLLELLADSKQKDRITYLISEWETLKWHEFDYRNKTK